MKSICRPLSIASAGIAALLIFIGVIPTSQSQERNSVNTGIVNKKNADEAKIEGIFEIQNLSDANLNTILDHPTPRFQLVIGCLKMELEENCKESAFRVELSEEAKMLIEKYWRDSLTFRYNTIIQSVPDANAGYRLDAEFFNLTTEFERGIEKTTLVTPKGKRQIYSAETGEITKSINIFAAKVIAKAKNTKE